MKNLSLKKIKIISVISMFALSFLYHFLYKWLPNPLFSVFLPVNESIWEHMKMIYSSILTIGILDYILIKKNNIYYNNFILQLSLVTLLSIPIYLLMYLPLRSLLGESMILSISLMFITYVIINIISYKIIYSRELNIRIFPIILIVLCYSLFTYLTYYPIHSFLFYDKTENKYGINDYTKVNNINGDYYERE